MTGLEVFLLVTGFACVCISFFVSRGRQEKGTEETLQTSSIWTEKEEQMIRERVNAILKERQNELVDTTEDQMNRICNDKIMAVDEFSRQILEKIENNHQEVVFMYNMLNEKEKNIKNVVIEPVHREVPNAPEQTVVNKTKKEPTALEKMQTKKETKEQTALVKQKAVTEIKKPNKKAEPAKTEVTKSSDDVNVRIQKMYKEGKSILEISKELNIGQGEVKLIIALYGGKKG